MNNYGEFEMECEHQNYKIQRNKVLIMCNLKSINQMEWRPSRGTRARPRIQRQQFARLCL